ncbi:MAG TPA: hypothetical protein VEA41_12625 [Salinarimonas sp.]|jgi:hypothetical protein|nr:hypothetical protein [Salinarimonas sp.]
MIPFNDVDQPCSMDLPLELRSLPGIGRRGEAGTARMVSGLALTAADDADVIAQDLACRGLLIPSSGRGMTATSSPTH